MATLTNRCQMIIALWICLFMTKAFADNVITLSDAPPNNKDIYIPLGLQTARYVDMDAPQKEFSKYSQHCSTEKEEYRPHRYIPKQGETPVDISTKAEAIPIEKCVMTMNEVVYKGSATFLTDDNDCALIVGCNVDASTPAPATTTTPGPNSTAPAPSTAIVTASEFCSFKELTLAEKGSAVGIQTIASPTCRKSGLSGTEKLLKRWRHTAETISKHYVQGSHTDSDNLQLSTKAFFYGPEAKMYAHVKNAKDYTGYPSFETPDPFESGKVEKTNKHLRSVTVRGQHECGMGCENGRVYSFLPLHENSFVGDMFVTNKCKWIDICMDANILPEVADENTNRTLYCNANKKLKVHIKANFAVGMWSKPGIPLRFFRNNEDYTRISLAKSVSGVISLTTGLGERALFMAYGREENLVAIIFSDDNCLKEGYGMRMSSRINAHDYVKDGQWVAVKDKVKHIDWVEKKEYVNNITQLSVQAEEGTVFEKPVEPILLKEGVPTTPRTPNPADSIGFNQGVQKSIGDHTAQKTGWMTWAVFFGSFAGTSVGFLSLGALFYFLRRTVYDDWYRGMYKRYQCDASGTTGGITGADFGATTMGGTSASQMSTVAGGTTGSGTTGMDTTGGGGTTAMNTTGGGGTTGGTTGGDTVGL